MVQPNRPNSFVISERHHQGVTSRTCEMAIAYPNGAPLLQATALDCAEGQAQGVSHRMAVDASLNEVIDAVRSFAGVPEMPSPHKPFAFKGIDRLRTEQPYAFGQVAGSLAMAGYQGAPELEGYCVYLRRTQGEEPVPRWMAVPSREDMVLPSIGLAQLAGELPLSTSLQATNMSV